MKRLIAGIMIVVLMISMIGCTKDEEKKVLHLGSMPTQSASIYAVGVEKGIFEKNGVNVELKIFKSGQERDAAAVAGEVDCFMTDVMGLVNLVDKGHRFKITSYEYENFGLMASGQSNIKEISDVDGQSIGIAENTVVEYAADMLLGSSNFYKVQVPSIPDRLATVLSNEVEMGVFPEPFISIIGSKGGAKLASTADMGIQPVVLVFSDELIKSKDEVVSFYKAYNETIDYMQSTPYDDYKQVLVNYGIVKEEMVDMVKIPVDEFAHASITTEADFNSVIKWMMDKGIIKQQYKLEDVSDDTFVKGSY